MKKLTKFILFFFFLIPLFSGVTLLETDPKVKRWAIVIGINDYNDVGITDLSKARNDAKIVGQILKEQGGFEKVFVMTDDLGSKDPLYPSRVNIELKLDNVLDFASSKDLIFFYFSGHGVSDNDGKGYILPVDTSMEKAFYTSVKLEELIRRISDKGIKKSLLVLDACRDVLASSKSSNKQGLQADKYEKADVAATLFSTKAGYYSFEDPKSDFGVFTKYLAYGLEGKADANGDGIISLSELEEYVQTTVSEWSQTNNKKQVPYLKYHREKFGDLPITVHGKREKSLVEENEYAKSDSRIQQALRSAIVPGWGQWYDGGKEKAVSFFSVWGLLLANSYRLNVKYENSKAEYKESFGLPALAGQGDMIFINYLLISPKREAVLNSQNALNTSFISLGVFWVWNMFDIFFFKKNEYLWSFQINLNLERNFYANTNSETKPYTWIQYDVRF